MLRRFPGLSGLLEQIRIGMLEGVTDFPALPRWARLPIIRRFVYRTLSQYVHETDPLIQRLVNYDRVRTPTTLSPEQIVVGGREMISATVTLVGPDGRVYVRRIAFPYGKPYDEGEFYHRLASSVGDDIAPRDPELTTKVRRSVIGVDWYIQRYVSI